MKTGTGWVKPDDGWLVTFGIQPTYPETGYGYIRRGEGVEAPQGSEADQD